MQRLTKSIQLYFSTTHGCQVTLCDHATHRLVHKGWKVMATHARLSNLLGLRCRVPTCEV